MEQLSPHFPGDIFSQVLARVVFSVAAEKLAREIETSAGRISELVRAIKEYTYMDQAPEQEVDIHHGIKGTLTMLKFSLKDGVEIKRDFDPNLPPIFAHGSEFNQVWTNLINNAIDAMNGKGELSIRTARELDCILRRISPGQQPSAPHRCADPHGLDRTIPARARDRFVLRREFKQRSTGSHLPLKSRILPQ